MDDDERLQPDHARPIGLYEQRSSGPNMASNSDEKTMRLKLLNDLALFDGSQIITNVHQNKKAFMDIIGKDIETHDVLVLTVKILAKISISPDEQQKSRLLLEMCNTQFMGSVLKYLLELPYADTKSMNSLYWKNQEEFWSNLITFCSYIVTNPPSNELMKYRSLVEAIIYCLNNLNDQNAFRRAQAYIKKFEELRGKLSAISNKSASALKQTVGATDTQDVQPPDDYRWLNIVPMSVDLSQHTPFLRPNIVQGAYHDVEHYLDVQFRRAKTATLTNSPKSNSFHEYLADH